MISVPNLRLRLSGNKRLILTGLLIFAMACSPKILVKKPGEKPKEKPETTEKEEAKEKPKEKESNSIALLLPFQLNRINAATASKTQIGKADLALW